MYFDFLQFVVILVCDESGSVEIVNQILVAFEGAGKLEVAMGRMQIQLADAAFAFYGNLQGETAFVRVIPMPVFAFNIAEITSRYMLWIEQAGGIIGLFYMPVAVRVLEVFFLLLAESTSAA